MLNNSSYMSAASANGAVDTNSVELCKTCHSGFGGVGEAAKKIKDLALGIIIKGSLSPGGHNFCPPPYSGGPNSSQPDFPVFTTYSK